MSSNKKVNLKKVILSAAIILLTLAGVLVYVLSWQGDTKDIEAVADSFKPLDGWQQTDSRVVPPRFLCFSGACPEASKSWTIKDKITQNSVKRFIGNSSDINRNHSRCVDYDDSKVLDSCEYVGERGDYQFSIMIDYNNSINSTEVYLFIRRKGQIYD